MALRVVPRLSTVFAFRSLCHLPRHPPSYSLVRPAEVSPLRHVPPHIPRPTWAEDGDCVLDATNLWEVRTGIEVQEMRDACRLARTCLQSVTPLVKPGITTDEIDAAVHGFAVNHNVYPSPLNYRGFPKSCCTSVNDVVAHGIPDTRPLEAGDIVNVDVTLFYKGFHGDVSEMFVVENDEKGVDEEGRRLLHATREAIDAAISVCRPGTTFGRVASAVTDVVDSYGFTVNDDFGGHGIGKNFHAAPFVCHNKRTRWPHKKTRMVPGMCFTIEPLICEGSGEIRILEDGWTVVSIDGGRGSLYEETCMVTENGVEVLTAFPRKEE